MSTNQKSTTLSGEITRFLLEWNRGDEDAMNEVVTRVYDELRGAARRYLDDYPGGIPTLSPTVLINEVYLRLLENKAFHFRNRTQFFWFAGQLMRHIIVDHARARLARKRGAGEFCLSLDRVEDFSQRSDLDLPTLIALDEALTRLEELDSRKSHIVALRFFAGLTFRETADVLEVSLTTVKREWLLAKHWLARELGERVLES